MTQQQMAAIKEAAEHAADNTTDLAFMALNTILRLLDEAEKDVCHAKIISKAEYRWSSDVWQCEIPCGEEWRMDCNHTPTACPGCGRTIAKEAADGQADGQAKA